MDASFVRDLNGTMEKVNRIRYPERVASKARMHEEISACTLPLMSAVLSLC